MAAQDLPETTRWIGVAANNHNDLAVSDVYQFAEDCGGEYLLDEAEERAQRHFEIDLLTVPRLKCRSANATGA